MRLFLSYEMLYQIRYFNDNIELSLCKVKLSQFGSKSIQVN